MELIQPGEIQDGKIVLPFSLDLDDGTKVVVRIEVITAPPQDSEPITLSPDQPTVKMSPEEFAALPFFGM